MNAEPDHLGVDPGGVAVKTYYAAIEGTGIKMTIECASAVVLYGSEERAVELRAVLRSGQVDLNQALALRMHWHKPNLAAFALDPEMDDTFPALYIPDPQHTELLAANAVIEQGRNDGSISNALQSVPRRSFEEPSSLRVAECRCAALIVIGQRPLDPVDGIPEHGVPLAEVIEERR